MEQDDPKRHIWDDVILSANFLGDRAMTIAQKGKINLAAGQY